MDATSIVQHTNRILQQARSNGFGSLVEAREFLRCYAGERSAFYLALKDVKQGWSEDYIADFVTHTLAAFTRYVEDGLLEGMSIERRAQIDVVSDILEQANTLLETRGVHPAAPAVLIGAALEEFLRNWVEASGLALGNKKPSIDAYSLTLREADLIAKQDVKDITSWAGTRNHAAHGEWDEVGNKDRVRLMLEGVNLFMRKHETA